MAEPLYALGTYQREFTATIVAAQSAALSKAGLA